MNNKIGRTLLIFASISVIILVVISSIKLLDSMMYRDADQSNIEYYENYYIATETLLDSLGIDCDDPIFKTDAGNKYRINKYNVELVFHSK